MTSLPEPQRIARFGVFEVDLRKQELRRAGLKIRLHEQPFQVLAALLESAGEVVTREELHRRIWPGGTFVDFESGLNTAVNKLREALGDSATSPRFVETVPRRGYRFLASVNALFDNGSVAVQEAPDKIRDISPEPHGLDVQDWQPATREERKWPWRSAPARNVSKWMTAMAFALGVLGGWAITRLREPAASETVLRLEIEPPEKGHFSFGLGLGGIALAPDGRTAAFVAATNGKTALWLRPLNGTAARLIAGTEGAAFPFWSPDSKSIAFFAAGKLQRVDVSDGTLATVCDAHRGWGGAWTSDGQIIFSAFGFGLRRVPASGGTPTPFTTLNSARGEGLHLWPQVLPGGRVLFFVQSYRQENAGVYVASLDKPAERVHLLTTDAKAIYASEAGGKDYLVWQRAGMLVAQQFDVHGVTLKGEVRTLGQRVAVFGGGMVNASISGGLLLCGETGMMMQLTWFGRKGERLGMVGESGEYVYFRLSPNGRYVVAARTKPDGRDLWLIDVGRGVADRITSSPGQKGYPVWSSDGRTILFASSAPYNLFGKAVEGGDEYRLTKSSNYQVPNDLPKSGRLLLYTEIGAGTGFDLWTLPMGLDGKPAPNAKPRPYLRTQFNEWNGRFSPERDPHLIAYESDESGRYDVYVDSFPEGRNRVPVSTGGGRYPQWSPEGHELFYVAPDGNLMEVSLKRGGNSIEVSSPRKLFPLPLVDTALSPYEVAPDGQRFLVRATPENRSGEPLTLIVNWPALLKSGAGGQ
jgi:DNA-binding winged helix-turn-helix (wHTH) protein/Tol biopolymer transport system component